MGIDKPHFDEGTEHNEPGPVDSAPSTTRHPLEAESGARTPAEFRQLVLNDGQLIEVNADTYLQYVEGAPEDGKGYNRKSLLELLKFSVLGSEVDASHARILLLHKVTAQAYETRDTNKKLPRAILVFLGQNPDDGKWYVNNLFFASNSEARHLFEEFERGYKKPLHEFSIDDVKEHMGVYTKERFQKTQKENASATVERMYSAMGLENNDPRLQELKRELLISCESESKLIPLGENTTDETISPGLDCTITISHRKIPGRAVSLTLRDGWLVNATVAQGESTRVLTALLDAPNLSARRDCGFFHAWEKPEIDKQEESARDWERSLQERERSIAKTREAYMLERERAVLEHRNSIGTIGRLLSGLLTTSRYNVQLQEKLSRIDMKQARAEQLHENQIANWRKEKEKKDLGNSWYASLGRKSDLRSIIVDALSKK